ncbi:hypothetical protein C8A05DRAFT_20502, partial [Staphylotrichum tortipilum]
NQTYPNYDHDNAQNHPDLQGRAFKAAYLHNAFTMAYLNVTSIGPSWRYLHSTPGQKFPLPLENPDDYLGPAISNFEPTWLLPRSPGGWNSGHSGMNVTYSNPYNISVANFQSIEIECTGAGGADSANISNIYVSCGLLRGPPRPVDAPSPLIFSSGSKWASSLYSCASAVKATIKTVTFTLDGNGNGSPNLSSLAVTSITPKTYPSPSSAPLWGVEDSGLQLFQIKPVWGLLSSGYSHMPNVSTVQKPELYLVGMGHYEFSLYFGRPGVATVDNMPAADFPFMGLDTVYYHLSSILSSGLPDYLGQSSLGSMAKWQAQVTNGTGAASMLNSIWADITVTAVVGTKGAHNVDGLRIAVRPVVRRVKYHMAFAVPAFVVLAASLAVLVAATVMAVLPRRSSLRVLRVNLKRTAVLTADSPEAAEGAFILGEREWTLTKGPKEVEFDPPAVTPTKQITPPQEGSQKSASPEQGQALLG